MSVFDNKLSLFNDRQYAIFGETVTHRDRYKNDASRRAIFEITLVEEGDLQAIMRYQSSFILDANEGPADVGDEVLRESGVKYRLTRRMPSVDLGRVLAINVEDQMKFIAIEVK